MAVGDYGNLINAGVTGARYLDERREKKRQQMALAKPEEIDYENAMLEDEIRRVQQLLENDIPMDAQALAAGVGGLGGILLSKYVHGGPRIKRNYRGKNGEKQDFD